MEWVLGGLLRGHLSPQDTRFSGDLYTWNEGRGGRKWSERPSEQTQRGEGALARAELLSHRAD